MKPARFYSRPPRLDGGGQAVHLGCVSRGGLLVETVQAGPDDMALRVRTGQRKDAAKLLLDDVSLQNLHPGVAGVDQRVPHLRKGFGAQPFVSGQQPAACRPGRVALAAAPALGFADDSLADLGEYGAC